MRLQDMIKSRYRYSRLTYFADIFLILIS